MWKILIFLCNLLVIIQNGFNFITFNKFSNLPITITSNSKNDELVSSSNNLQVINDEGNEQYSGQLADYFSIRNLFENLQERKEALRIFWITEEAIEWSLGTNFAANFFHHLSSVWEAGVPEDRAEFDTVISNLLLNWDNDEFDHTPIGVTEIINEIFHDVRDAFFNQIFSGALNDIFNIQFFNSPLMEWPAVHFKVPYWLLKD